jgi:hypothetical protein
VLAFLLVTLFLGRIDTGGWTKSFSIVIDRKALHMKG